MPARARSKGIARARPQRQPTQFGELETTPTYRHHGSPGIPIESGAAVSLADGSFSGEAQALRQIDEYDDGLDDGDFARLEDTQRLEIEYSGSTTFQWSETESLAKRSSPLRPGETPSAAWKFDEYESLPPLSSPKSGRSKLPDTAPLPVVPPSPPAPMETSTPHKRVDFSETASTMLRSSPFGVGDSVKGVFEMFDDDRSSIGPAKSDDRLEPYRSTVVGHNSSHLPSDNIYDTTPELKTARRDAEAFELADPVPLSPRLCHPTLNSSTHKRMRPPEPPKDSAVKSRPGCLTKSGGHRLAASSQQDVDSSSLPQKRSDESSVVPSSDPAHSSVAPTRNERARRRKQRAKPPLPFDDLTQELREQPAKPSPHVRMPIVNALRESVQPSSSPAAAPDVNGSTKRVHPKKRTKAALKGQVTPVVDTEKSRSDLSKCLAPSKQLARKRKKASPCFEPNPPQPRPVAPSKPIVVSSNDDSSSDLSDLFLPSSGPLTFEPQKDAVAPAKGNVGYANDPETRSQLPPTCNDDLPPPPAHSQSIHETLLTNDNVEPADPPRTKFVVVEDKRGHSAPVDKGKMTACRDATARTFEASGTFTERVHSRNLSPIRISPGKQEGTPPGRRQNLAARQPSRNYSISIHGSPLPTRRQAADKQIAASDGTDDILSRESTYLRHHVLWPQKSEGQLPTRALPFGQIASQVQPAQNGGGRSSDMKVPRLSQSQGVTTPAVQAILKGVHAQILASLDLSAVPPGSLCKDPKAGSEEAISHENGDSGSGQQDRAPDKLSQKLHQLVETMMEHLGSKKVNGLKSAEVYRTKITACVDKIQDRHAKERHALEEQIRHDEKKFGAVVQTAARTVEDRTRMREIAITELEKSLEQRRAVFEQATSALRALHRQLQSDDVHLNMDLV